MKLSTSLGLLFACATGAFAQSFTGAGFTFVDGTATAEGVAFGDVTVTGLVPGSTLQSITLTSLTHTYIGDTVFQLAHDQGDPATDDFVNFISPPDARSANFNGTYTFVPSATLPTVDEATAGQTTGFNLPSGTYSPSSYGGGTANGPRVNYSVFDGDLNGTWTLFVADFFPGDTGAIGSYTLNFAPPAAVPEPATMAVLGLGAAALLRRRRRSN